MPGRSAGPIGRPGIDPATVGFVEGHGLGVPASDRAELRALHAVFPPARDGARSALGAVSALIGHAMPAAGMAGLIKAALALHHRVLPPTPHADDPHPAARGRREPVRPDRDGPALDPRRARPPAAGRGQRLRLRRDQQPTRSSRSTRPSADGDHARAVSSRWETEAILLAAPDRARLGRPGAGAARLARSRARTGRSRSRTWRTRSTRGTPEGRCRLGLVVGVARRPARPAPRRDREAGEPGLPVDPRRPRRLLLGPAAGRARGRWRSSSPARGSQYPGMLADLCRHFPEVRAWFDTADRVALRRGTRLAAERDPLRRLGPRGETPSGRPARRSTSSSRRQWAIHQLLGSLGLRPDAVVGH